MKDKRHKYDKDVSGSYEQEDFLSNKCCLFEEVKYMVQDDECVIALWHTLDQKKLVRC